MLENKKKSEWWRTPNQHILRAAKMMRSFSKSYMNKFMWEQMSKEYQIFCSLMGFTSLCRPQPSKKVKTMTEPQIFQSCARKFRSNG